MRWQAVLALLGVLSAMATCAGEFIQTYDVDISVRVSRVYGVNEDLPERLR